MKIRVLAVALIGLLLATGLVLVGCDFDSLCPRNGACKLKAIGTGTGYITLSKTDCGEEKCAVNKIRSASSGYEFETWCNTYCAKLINTYQSIYSRNSL